MERRPVGNPYHRAFRVCGGNFPQYALRHPGNAGDFSPAGGQHLLCRISPMATVIRYGIFASPLIFGRLSMVSVGFCAILVGLGVDFAILTFGRYQQARTDGESHHQAIATSIAKLGRAIFFGALTTAVGFLALVLSGSMGFSQLGVLIAIGIFVAGLFMCTILFLFIREQQEPVRHVW